MKALRAKPLIDDITHKKPGILFRPSKPIRALKLASTLRVPNEYEQKLQDNLYSDIMSMPVRLDKVSKLRYPQHFLLKFSLSVRQESQAQHDSTSVKKGVRLRTTDPALSAVAVRPELDMSFKKFESIYVFSKRAQLVDLIGKPKARPIFIPMSIATLRNNEFALQNITLDFDIASVDQLLRDKLGKLAAGLSKESMAGGTEMKVVLDSAEADQKTLSTNVLDFSDADESFKDILNATFPQHPITLPYNNHTKSFIQFVHQIIIYFS